MSAAAHFLLLNWLVNKRRADARFVALSILLNLHALLLIHSALRYLCCSQSRVGPQVGFEPTTRWLTVNGDGKILLAIKCGMV